MKISERRCDVCGTHASPDWTSAIFARVIWLCADHGRAFHGSFEHAAARTSIRSSTVARLVDGWLARARAAVIVGRRAA